MKIISSIIILGIIICLSSFAQTSRPVGEPDASKVGVESAQQHLTDVTVTNFEDASFWFSGMMEDQGMIMTRMLEGKPAARVELDAQRLKDEAELGIPEGNNVLGVRVDFYKRGMNQFHVYPMRPIAIEGICKTISVWVVGRNFKHLLKIIISDYYGNYQELTLGKLNFTGWKKMTVAVPPHIAQTDYHYSNRNGLKVLGLKVECDLEESWGRYYIYFDDMSAVTDLFMESNLDPDDMQDIW
jgi:hypothetical protein